MICCNQVTKIHSTRYGFAIASSARGPCNFGPFTDLAISVFREMSINTVLTQILMSLCTIPAEIITDTDRKYNRKQLGCIRLQALQFYIKSKTINPHQDYRRYRRYSFNKKKRHLARIQAFTFSSQDHGRLNDKHISKHSR